MSALERFEKEVKKQVLKVSLEIEYTPGTTEDLDLYEASHSGFKVSSFGPTKEKAMASARIQLEALFLKYPELLKLIK